ncbi:hypothetical protein ID866_8930 [Astraeus odoratus]|nr:hypothetical protein ID866_8930 [Astraeus odoratus]
MSQIDVGVEYTHTALSTGTLSDDFLEKRGVKYIRIQWVDLSNHVHCRVLTLSHFRKLRQAARPGVTITKAVFGLVFLNMAEGFGPVGEYVLVMDLSSLRLCGYAPGHAAVFGYFQEKTPIGGRLEVPLCPRTNLRRIITCAEKLLGTKFLVGFETEFILLKSTYPIKVVNNYGWSRTAALGTGTPEFEVLEEIADALTKSGIELQMYHSEGAPGQYEVITGPLSPLEAADALVHTRETIYNIARKHGLYATLAPRLHSDSCGSGAHVHVSVHPTRDSSPPSETHPSLLTTLESHFLSGLVSHLPSVLAFTLPLPQSYARMKDGIWSGGTWSCWGVENKEVPIRLTNPASPRTRNFEVKLVDGTASPYLAVAGILSAGIVGIRDRLALNVGNCAGKTAAEMTEAERKDMGITTRLPLDVENARKHLLEDAKITEVLGEEVVRGYASVNRTLERVMLPSDGEAEAAAVARFIETY